MGRNRLYDQALEDALVNAVTTTIEDRGVEQVSLRTVARDAGTTTNAVYTLFGSRSQLIARSVIQAIDRLGAFVFSDPMPTDPYDRLRTIGIRYREWSLENPHLAQAIFDLTNRWEVDNSKMIERFEAARAETRRILGEMNEKAQLSPEQIDTLTAAVGNAIQGSIMIELGARDRFNGHQSDLDLVHTASLDLLINGLQAIFRGIETPRA